MTEMQELKARVAKLEEMLADYERLKEIVASSLMLNAGDVMLMCRIIKRLNMDTEDSIGAIFYGLCCKSINERIAAANSLMGEKDGE